MMSDPLSKMRLFLAENAASLELAKLGMERDRRNGIKPRLRRDPDWKEERCKGMKGFVDVALEDHRARKKANSQD